MLQRFTGKAENLITSLYTFQTGKNIRDVIFEIGMPPIIYISRFLIIFLEYLLIKKPLLLKRLKIYLEISIKKS